MSETVMIDDLRRCTAEFVFHARLQGGYVLHRRCVEHPALTIIEGRERKTGSYRRFRVGDRECATLEEAVDLLNREYAS